MADATPLQTVHCARCGRPDAPALPRRPLPGSQGDELRQRICTDCWNDWLRMEVMVINELRLNFMDPAAQETLNQHMWQFLFPAEAGEAGEDAGEAGEDAGEAGEDAGEAGAAAAGDAGPSSSSGS